VERRDPVLIDRATEETAMPTGYTSALYEGQEQSFAEFAMNCARAFGPLVELRDAPDAQIPERFEPSNYARGSFEEARARYAELFHRSRSEWVEVQNADLAQHNAMVRDARRQARERRSRYQGMLHQVRQWQPPTEEHVALRDFMVEQLERSIDVDCSTTFLDLRKPVQVDRYAEQATERAWQHCLRAEKAWHEEQRRAEQRTEWVRSLRRSLPASEEVRS
jgi:hypothetical protein